jgi:two-component system response regulator YesN
MKLRVLVVEDELLVRVGIKSSIDWEGNGFTLIGEAIDGMEALSLFRIHLPDIVLLDIRLPDISGLEVLKTIRLENPETKVIVISGLDDFETTRKAFQFGAHEYFHKPRIQSGDLLKLLNDIKAEMKDAPRPNTTEDQPPTVLEILRDALSFPLSKEASSKLSASIPARAYIVMMVSLTGLYERKMNRQFNEEITFNAAMNLIAELASRREEIEFFSSTPNEYFFLFRADDLETSLIKCAKNFYTALSNMLRRYIDVASHAGVSSIKYQYEDLQIAIFEAREANESYFILLEPFIKYVDRYTDSADSVEVARLIDVLIYTARRAQVDVHLQHMQKLVDFMRKKGNPSRKTLIHNSLTFIYLAGLNHKDGEGDGLRLDSCETLDQFLQCYTHILSGIARENNSILKNGLAKQIKDYLYVHYSDDISLQSLSEEFHLSKNYISRAFKAEEGTNLFTWLNMMRIEKSQQLLIRTTLRIYEIAEATGFASTVSFNYAFNRVVGMSPSQYREEHSLDT